MENRGILYVFPVFHSAWLAKKISFPAADDLFRDSLTPTAAVFPSPGRIIRLSSEKFFFLALLAGVPGRAEVELLAFDGDGGAGGYGLGDEHVGADDAALTNHRIPTQHRGAGIDGHIVGDGGVAALAPELLASMESFQAKATYNNVKYKPMRDPQEHETSDSYGITITVTEIVIEDIDMFRELMASMKSGTTPQLVFQGVLQGLNGSEERVVYRECIPSGDIDLQNVANGDVIKRIWNFFVNGKPDLQKELSI